jgi:hypothetical protein
MPATLGRYREGTGKVQERYREGLLLGRDHAGHLGAGGVECERARVVEELEHVLLQKIQGRYREGTGKVQGRYREGTGKVQGRYREGTGRA